MNMAYLSSAAIDSASSSFAVGIAVKVSTTLLLDPIGFAVRVISADNFICAGDTDEGKDS